jgi:hypothetical protein
MKGYLRITFFILFMVLSGFIPTNSALCMDKKQVEPTKSVIIVDKKIFIAEGIHNKTTEYFRLRDLAMILNGSIKQFSIGIDERGIMLTPSEPYTPIGTELFISDNEVIESAKMVTIRLFVKEDMVQLKGYFFNNTNYINLDDLGKLMNFNVDIDQRTNDIIVNTSENYEKKPKQILTKASSRKIDFDFNQSKKVEQFLTKDYRAIHHAKDNLYIAAGDDGVIEISRDGTNWTEVDSGSTSSLQYITSNETNNIVIGDRNTILYSDTGTYWEKAKINNLNEQVYFRGLASSNQDFVCVAIDYDLNGYILYSEDGINWDCTGGYGEIISVICENGIFYAQSDGIVYYSQNGLEWYTKPSKNKKAYLGFMKNNFYLDDEIFHYNFLMENIYFDKVFYINDTYVCLWVNTIYVSKDGVNWRSTYNSFDKRAVENDVSDIIWDGKKYIAVGYDNVFVYSYDGVKWHNIKERNQSFGSINKVMWDEETFIFTTANNSYQSVDGFNWKINKISYDNDYIENGKSVNFDFHDFRFSSNIIYHQNKYIGIFGCAVYTSKDGANWKINDLFFTKKNENHNFSIDEIFNVIIYKIAYFKNKYIALGNNGYIALSTDLSSWEIIDSGVNCSLLDIAFNNDTYIITGARGTLLYSENLYDWNRIDIGYNTTLEGCFWNGTFFATTDDKNFWISSDGREWIRIKLPISDNELNIGVYTTDFCFLNEFLWTGYEFIKVADLYGEGTRFLVSKDGLNWSKTISNDLKYTDIDGIVTNGEILLIFRPNSNIYLYNLEEMRRD